MKAASQITFRDRRQARRQWWPAMAGVGLLLAACGSGGAAPANSQPPGGGATVSVSTSTSTDPASGTAVTGEYLAALPAKVRESKTWVVGTNGAIPACIYLDNETNSFKGIDVDVLQAAADRIGIRLEWQQVTYDAMIPGVQSGRFDLAMGCITDKVEREELVTFVNHARGSTAIIVRSDNPAGITGDPLSLCGKNLAVNTGTIYIPMAESMNDECLKAGQSAINIAQLPSQPDAITAMQSGRADAELQNLSGAMYLADLNDLDIKYFLNEDYMPSGIMGVITRKDDTATQDVLLEVFEGMWADGTYAGIMTKWGVASEQLEAPGINLQGQAEAAGK